MRDRVFIICEDGYQHGIPHPKYVSRFNWLLTFRLLFTINVALIVAQVVMMVRG